MGQRFWKDVPALFSVIVVLVIFCSSIHQLDAAPAVSDTQSSIVSSSTRRDSSSRDATSTIDLSAGEAGTTPSRRRSSKGSRSKKNRKGSFRELNESSTTPMPMEETSGTAPTVMEAEVFSVALPTELVPGEASTVFPINLNVTNLGESGLPSTTMTSLLGGESMTDGSSASPVPEEVSTLIAEGTSSGSISPEGGEVSTESSTVAVVTEGSFAEFSSIMSETPPEIATEGLHPSPPAVTSEVQSTTESLVREFTGSRGSSSRSSSRQASTDESSTASEFFTMGENPGLPGVSDDASNAVETQTIRGETGVRSFETPAETVGTESRSSSDVTSEGTTVKNTEPSAEGSSGPTEVSEAKPETSSVAVTSDTGEPAGIASEGSSSPRPDVTSEQAETASEQTGEAFPGQSETEAVPLGTVPGEVNPETSSDTPETSPEQPEILPEQPETSSQQPETLPEQLETSPVQPATSEQIDTTPEQQETPSDQPGTPSEQSPILAEQTSPETSSERPESTAEHSETPDQPGTSPEQPETPTEQSATVSEQSGTVSEQTIPDSTSEQPEIPSEQPLSPSEQPESPSEQPMVPSEQPEVPSEQPEVPSEQPEVPSEQPEVPSEQPEVPSEQPEVPSEQPGIPSEQPEVPSEQPEVPSERPEVPSEQPVTSSEGPETPSEPDVSSDRPEPSEQPDTSSVQPTETTSEGSESTTNGDTTSATIEVVETESTTTGPTETRMAATDFDGLPSDSTLISVSTSEVLLENGTTNSTYVFTDETFITSNGTVYNIYELSSPGSVYSESSTETDGTETVTPPVFETSATTSLATSPTSSQTDNYNETTGDGSLLVYKGNGKISLDDAYKKALEQRARRNRI